MLQLRNFVILSETAEIKRGKPMFGYTVRGRGHNEGRSHPVYGWNQNGWAGRRSGVYLEKQSIDVPLSICAISPLF